MEREEWQVPSDIIQVRLGQSFLNALSGSGHNVNGSETSISVQGKIRACHIVIHSILD